MNEMNSSCAAAGQASLRGGLAALISAALLSLSAAGCSAAAGAGPRSPEAGPQAAGSLASIAFPAADWQQPARQTSAPLLFRPGSDFEPALPLLNAQLDKQGGVLLSGDYLPGLALSRLACCSYNFQLGGYGGPGRLQLSWAEAPAPGECWIGLSNYSKHAWEWHACPIGSGLPFNLASGDYQDPSGQLQVVVCIAAQATADLFAISIGADAYPVALCRPLDYYANPGEPVTIDASASFDPGGSIAKYEFDPENDGSFVDKGAASSISHTYSKSGDTTVHVRVTDSAGQTSEGCEFVHVSWQHTFHGLGSYATGSAAAALPDGRVCFGGSIDNLTPDQPDGALLMLDAAGQRLWCKSLGQAGSDQVSDVVADKAGMLYASVDLNTGTLQEQNLLVKFTPEGSPVWQKQISGELLGRGRLAVDSQGRIDLLADAGLNPPSVLEYLQFGSDGSLLQQTTITCSNGLYAGGLCVDSSDRPYLCGFVGGLDPNLQGAFLIGLAEDGGLRFARHFKDAIGSGFYCCCCAGGQIILGGQKTAGQEHIPLAAAFSTDGQLLWARSLAYGSGPNQMLSSVRVRAGGGAVFCGNGPSSNFDNQALLVQLDPGGALLSSLGFGSLNIESEGNGLSLGPRGEVYICGYSQLQQTGFSKQTPVLADFGKQTAAFPQLSQSSGSLSVADADAHWQDSVPDSADEGRLLCAQYFPAALNK